MLHKILSNWLIRHVLSKLEWGWGYHDADWWIVSNLLFHYRLHVPSFKSHWWIQGGVRGTRPRSNFFHFHAVFGENLAK